MVSVFQRMDSTVDTLNKLYKNQVNINDQYCQIIKWIKLFHIQIGILLYMNELHNGWSVHANGSFVVICPSKWFACCTEWSFNNKTWCSSFLYVHILHCEVYFFLNFKSFWGRGWGSVLTLFCRKCKFTCWNLWHW